MFARYTFTFLAAVFAVCVLVQVFLAGLAIFVHQVYWVRHTSFIHFFEIIPLLMLLFGWLGKVPQRLRWQSAGLFGLIFLQYFTANIRAALPAVAATHPVIALVLTGLAFSVLVEAWKFTPSVRQAAGSSS